MEVGLPGKDTGERLGSPELPRSVPGKKVREVEDSGQTVATDTHGAHGVEAEESEVGEVVASQGFGFQVGVHEPYAPKPRVPRPGAAHVGELELVGAPHHHEFHFALPVDENPHLAASGMRQLGQVARKLGAHELVRRDSAAVGVLEEPTLALLQPQGVAEDFQVRFVGSFQPKPCYESARKSTVAPSRKSRPPPPGSRPDLSAVRRLVVKVGTGALTHADGRFNRPHFERLCEDFLWASRGRQLAVVSSGAIALGVEHLGLSARPRDIPGKQACAAVGQSRLMHAYASALGERKKVAQLLLTHDDVQDRRRYLNAKHALERLWAEDVLPVVNENDTVSVDELKFGDNDALAALVALLVEAEVLVILSDVEGLYERSPVGNLGSKVVPEVAQVTPEVLALAGESSSGLGVGGMASKVRAAARATELGVSCFVISGKEPGRLPALLSGENVGTWFRPQRGGKKARASWISHALVPLGMLRVDDGARRAILESHKSLLPSGVSAVEGDFQEGEPVDLADLAGNVFARGLVAYGSEALRRIAGKKSSEFESLLGYRSVDEAVHRDDLVLLANGEPPGGYGR